MLQKVYIRTVNTKQANDFIEDVQDQVLFNNNCKYLILCIILKY